MSDINLYADIAGGLNAWNIPTILGLLIGMGGIASGFWIAQRSRREKELWYTIFSPRLFVGSALGRPTPSSIKITYERTDGSTHVEPEVVPQIFLSEVGFVNMGRLPVMRIDLAQQDPLRVEIASARILDIAISNTSRSASGIALGLVEHGQGSAAATIEFDFLDHLDGARIQILTTEATVRVALRGTIVGMPAGLKRMAERPSGYLDRPVTFKWAAGVVFCATAFFFGILVLVDFVLETRSLFNTFSFITAAMLTWLSIGAFARTAQRLSKRAPLPLDFPSIELTA